jgi:hypothetical protein
VESGFIFRIEQMKKGAHEQMERRKEKKRKVNNRDAGSIVVE